MNEADRKRLAKLQGFYAANGIMPTIRELCKLIGYSSNNAGWKFMKRLEGFKIIARMGSRWRPLNDFFI